MTELLTSPVLQRKPKLVLIEKAYLEPEDLVGPKVDAENQARGAEEIVGILMQRGAKIVASELSGLKELTKKGRPTKSMP